MYPISVAVGYGNVKGGNKVRDLDQRAPENNSKGLVWEDRIPLQVKTILQNGWDVFFSTECRNDNNMYLLLLEALKDADSAGDWRVQQGDGSNQCYYKGSKFTFIAHTDYVFTAHPNTTGSERNWNHTTLRWIESQTDWNFVNTHMHPFAPDARVQDAKELRDWMRTKNIDLLTGDFNAASRNKNQPRWYWEQDGWKGIRDRGPVLNVEIGTAPDGNFIEDFYTKPSLIADVTGMKVINAKKAKLTDHVGWLSATLVKMVAGTPGTVAENRNDYIDRIPSTAPYNILTYSPPADPIEYKYICQNLLTGEFLTMDLPIATEGPNYELSAAGSLSGIIAPEMRYKVPLEEWQTAIYAEANGEIRWGGIVQGLPSVGSELSVEAAGFVSYPRGEPYAGKLYKKIDWDPLTAYTDLWKYLQDRTDSDLGISVIVPADRPQVRIGTKEEPYILAPEEAPDIGDEMDRLATDTPFEYVERHYWSGSKIKHEIIVGSPRLGRKRTDLAFVQGENVISVVPVNRDGDTFANSIYGIGKGEGKSTVRVEIAQRDGRLKRTKVHTDKTANTADRLGKSAQQEFAKSQLLPEISSIQVRHHRSAPIGSWSLGDDIMIIATIPWEGEVAIWSRIVSWQQNGQDTATINLVRSEIASSVVITQPGPLLVPVTTAPLVDVPVVTASSAKYDVSPFDTAFFA